MDRQSLSISRICVYLCLFVAFSFISACTSPNPTPPTAVSDASETTAPTTISPTTVVRTLVPTFTPIPSATSLPTPTSTIALPTATSVANTPIPFDKTVVELRYTIPVLGLDRRLEGKLGGEMIVADEATGIILQRSSQGNVVAELRQILPEVTLEPLSDGCESCVQFSYSLPEEGLEAEGWLQDTRLLASVENYFRFVLGPHFPTETLVALHRAPSPYAPAHSVALTADGRLWRWLATDAQIAEPTTAPLPIQTALTSTGTDALAAAYEADCLGSTALELLQIGEQQFTIRCPEFSLPSSLVFLYETLDEAARPLARSLDAPQRPPARFPVAALADYRRANGEQLTLFYDGRVTALTTGGVVTTTLPLTQTTALVTTLLDSNELQLGLTTFAAEDEATPVASRNHLLVRGAEGVFDGVWETAVSLLAPLDDLLAALADSLAIEEATPMATEVVTLEPTTESETPDPTFGATPEPTIETTPEPTPVAPTATLEVTTPEATIIATETAVP